MGQFTTKQIVVDAGYTNNRTGAVAAGDNVTVALGKIVNLIATSNGTGSGNMTVPTLTSAPSNLTVGSTWFLNTSGNISFQGVTSNGSVSSVNMTTVTTAPNVTLSSVITVGAGASSQSYLSGGSGGGQVVPLYNVSLAKGTVLSFAVAATTAANGNNGSSSTLTIGGTLNSTALGGQQGIKNGGAGSGNGGQSGSGNAGGVGAGSGGNYGGGGGAGNNGTGVADNSNATSGGVNPSGNGGIGYTWVDGKKYGNGGGGSASDNHGTPYVGRGAGFDGFGNGQQYSASGNINITAPAQQASNGQDGRGGGGGGGNSNGGSGTSNITGVSC